LPADRLNAIAFVIAASADGFDAQPGRDGIVKYRRAESMRADLRKRRRAEKAASFPPSDLRFLANMGISL
jgi:hypothetical protein